MFDGLWVRQYNSVPLTRGGAVWQLVGLITRRSQVQILSPQPTLYSLCDTTVFEARVFSASKHVMRELAIFRSHTKTRSGGFFVLCRSVSTATRAACRHRR